MRRGPLLVLFASACASYGENAKPNESPANIEAGANDDASSAVDAGTDGRDRPFCNDAGGRFCADFDGVLAVSDGFTGLNMQNGATFALDSTRSTSRPNSALISLAASTATCVYAQLVRNPTSLPKRTLIAEPDGSYWMLRRLSAP